MLIVALSAALAAPASAQVQTAARPPEAGVLLVAGDDLPAAARRHRATLGPAVRGTAFRRLSVPPQRVEAVLAALRRDRSVRAVQPNWSRTASAEPDDELYAKGRQTWLKTLRMAQAWDLQPSAAGVKVAILDSGVASTHPDLAAALLPGRDFVNGDDSAYDDNGHGTMVAGTAAAPTGNGTGMASPGGGASILPGKVLDADGFGYDDEIAAGIAWAADAGAGVINLSLGGPEDSAILREAVAYAQSRDAVVVAAAGNEGLPLPEYPAALPGVVGVGATDWGGELAYFSSVGPHVDLVAPGWRMLSTAPAIPDGYKPLQALGTTDWFETGSGTSLAAPLVAGVAALVRARSPELTAPQVAARLRATAHDLGSPGIDDHFGHGMVDPVAALGGSGKPPQALPEADANGTPARATPITIHSDVRAGLADGRIERPGDADWYAFDVDSPAEWEIWVDPREPTWEHPDVMEADWQLYAPGGRPFAHRGVRSGGERTTLRLHEPGRWLLEVRNLRGSRGSGDYKLEVRRGQGIVPPDPFHIDPDAHVPSIFATTAVAVGDVTGDARDDVLMTAIASGASTGELHVLEQTDEGWLRSPVRLPLLMGGLDQRVVVAELSGDGNADAIVSSSAGMVLFLQRDGRLEGPTPVAGTTGSNQPAVADWDGDGDRDVLFITSHFWEGAPDGIFLLENDGHGAFAAPRMVVSDVRTGGDMEVGDIDGDGRPDIVADVWTPYGQHHLRIVRQNGDGTLTQETLQHRSFCIELADLTGDGRRDVLVCDDGDIQDLVFVLPQTSAGTLGTPQPIGNSLEADVGDFDADGRADVVGGHFVLLQQDDGTLQPMPGTETDRAMFAGPTAGDITGDGYDDVVSIQHRNLYLSRQRTSGWPRPLWVQDTVPAAHATGVATGVAPAVRFGRAIDAGSLTAATVVLRDTSTGTTVDATRSYAADTRTLTVTPSSPLVAGRTYALIVDGIRDATGAVMGRGSERAELAGGELRSVLWPVYEKSEVRFTVGSPEGDTSPPDTSFVYGPSGVHRTGDMRMAYASDEQAGTFQCSRDAEPWVACSRAGHGEGYLDDGPHSVRVRAVDPSGNADPTPAERDWVADSTRPAPGNSHLMSALPLSGASGAVSGAITAPRELYGRLLGSWNRGGDPVFYKWTAPADGKLTVDTAGSEFDTLLGVTRGTEDYLSPRIASDDDAGPGHTSHVAVDVEAGVTYGIGVDGFNHEYGDEESYLEYSGAISNGPFVLNWSFESMMAPLVSTGVATYVRDTEATLAGRVDPKTLETTYHFEYGTSPLLEDSTASAKLAAGSAAQTVTMPLSDLEPLTKYHYRLVAANADGTTAGEVRTFTTLAPPPVLKTGPALDVTSRGARLTATIDTHGEMADWFFEYGPDASYGSTVTVASGQIGSDGPADVSAVAAGLEPERTYHYRIVARSGAGRYVAGEDATFTTTADPPAAATGAAESVGSTLVTMTATVDPAGTSTRVWFAYGPDGGVTKETGVQTVSGDAPQTVKATVDGLAVQTTYGFRVVAESAGGRSEGTLRTFTTLPWPPGADSGAATDVTRTTARLNGIVRTGGGPTTWWFEYGPTGSYGSTTPAVDGGDGEQPFAVSHALTGLSPEQTLHYRLVARNAAGTSSGADRTLTTAASPPGVTTLAASAVAEKGATLNGKVDPRGRPATAWFEYGSGSGYTARTTDLIVPADGAGPQPVAAALEALAPDTEYHVRLVAAGPGGTSFGENVTFRTAKAPAPEPDPTPSPPSPTATPAPEPPVLPGLVPPPEPPSLEPSPAPPGVSLALPAGGRLRSVSGAVTLRVSCSSACRLEAALTSFGRRLGRATKRRAAPGVFTVRIRLNAAGRRAVPRRGSVKATVRLAATGGGGTTRLARPVRISAGR